MGNRGRIWRFYPYFVKLTLQNLQNIYINAKFICKNLHISNKSCNFAP